MTVNLPKIMITDDFGNQIKEMTVPIPFYVKINFDKREKIRYRVRIIDDNSKVRGQYTGITHNHFLNLHIPLIRLPTKTGKLRILVEESSVEDAFYEQYQITISYIEFRNEINHKLSKQLVDILSSDNLDKFNTEIERKLQSDEQIKSKYFQNRGSSFQIQNEEKFRLKNKRKLLQGQIQKESKKHKKKKKKNSIMKLKISEIYA